MQAARRVAIGAAVVVIAIVVVRLMRQPSQDLLNNREFGRPFAVGAPLYSGHANYPYLPTWAAVHAPLAWLPERAASIGVLWTFIVILAAIVFARMPAEAS